MVVGPRHGLTVVHLEDHWREAFTGNDRLRQVTSTLDILYLNQKKQRVAGK